MWSEMQWSHNNRNHDLYEEITLRNKRNEAFTLDLEVMDARRLDRYDHASSSH